MKTFKLGFLGGGLDSVVGYSHFVASQMDKRFIVESGVCSRDDDINDDTAEYWHINRKYNSVDEFIENEKDKLDIMSVLLPTPDHFETVKKLMEYKIPIICEKPLFASLEECEYLKENSLTDNNFLVTTYNYIAYPILFKLREIILNNDIGNIINIHLEMPQESFLNPPKSVDYPSEWRKKDGAIPSILLDLLSHLFSLSLYLTEKTIVNVNSKFNKFSKYNVVDDVKVLTEYNDGTSGMFWVSKIAIGNKNGLKLAIYGEKGSAEWVQENPEKLIINRKGKGKTILERGSDLGMSKNKLFNRMTPGHPSGYIEAFANLYCNIADALDIYKKGGDYKGNPLIWTFEKEYENFKFMDAVVRSNAESQIKKVL